MRDETCAISPEASSGSTWVYCGTEYLNIWLDACGISQPGNHDAYFPTRAYKKGVGGRENMSLFLLAEYWLEAMFLFLELLLNEIALKCQEQFPP